MTHIRMESSVSSTEAARHLGDLLARVKYAGESFVLLKSDKPLARLVPIRSTTRARGADIMAVLASQPHDPGFADDLERVNRMDRAPANPWD
jgi:antitoxin (DNA-binding transcriptional repressor) of toxin-antitoxin stability system